jgi:hypothetical protein
MESGAALTPVEEIISNIQKYRGEVNKKALSYNDLDNWKYIEFFINYHLNKV